LNLQQSDHEVDAQCPIPMLNSNITFVPVDPRLKSFHLQNSLGLDFLEDPIRISDERNAELAPSSTFTQRGDPRQRAMAYKGPRVSSPGAQIFGSQGGDACMGRRLGFVYRAGLGGKSFSRTRNWSQTLGLGSIVPTANRGWPSGIAVGVEAGSGGLIINRSKTESTSAVYVAN